MFYPWLRFSPTRRAGILTQSLVRVDMFSQSSVKVLSQVIAAMIAGKVGVHGGYHKQRKTGSN